jgi:hypothetical protein
MTGKENAVMNDGKATINWSVLTAGHGAVTGIYFYVFTAVSFVLEDTLTELLKTH